MVWVDVHFDDMILRLAYSTDDFTAESMICVEWRQKHVHGLYFLLKDNYSLLYLSSYFCTFSFHHLRERCCHQLIAGFRECGDIATLKGLNTREARWLDIAGFIICQVNGV